MIRSIATTTVRCLKTYNLTKFSRPFVYNPKYNMESVNFTKKITFQFADYPKHEVLTVN
jgi:hypothetical protein